MGNHLGNWSRIQETANQISQITEVSHNPRASCTGFKSLYRRKTARMTSLATMTIRYGLILLEAMGTFRESGCLASSILRTFRNKIQKIVSMIRIIEKRTEGADKCLWRHYSPISGSSSGSGPRFPCWSFQSSILSRHPPSFLSSHLSLPTK